MSTLELLTIKNKKHGKEYPVTSEEWANMQKKGHDKAFIIIDRKAVNQPLVDQPKRITAPPEALPEVVEIIAKKHDQAEAAQPAPKQRRKKGEAAAAKGAIEHA